MPKLRNAETPIGAFTEYLARKVKIHQPQVEFDTMGTKGHKRMPRFGTKQHPKGAEVHMLDSPRNAYDEPNVFIAISPKGRAMKVTVEEVDPDAYPTAHRKAVGD